LNHFIAAVVVCLCVTFVNAQQASWPNKVKNVSVSGTVTQVDSYLNGENTWNKYRVWVKDAQGKFWQVWTDAEPTVSVGQPASYVGDAPYGDPIVWNRFVINSR
jgi:hypothetical protein